MKTLRFGIKIETIGQTRDAVARAIKTVVGGEVVGETDDEKAQSLVRAMLATGLAEKL